MLPAQHRRLTLALLIVVCCTFVWRPGSAQEVKPIFRLEAAGPTSYVTSLEFSPDGRTLYIGGFDKVVRVWKLNDRTGQFELDDRAAFRVPIGPGQSGAVNAIAVSSDGNWLAVGGRGTVMGEAGFREHGRVVPIEAISDRMRLDLGTIHVFNTQNREMKSLRGHHGEILSMTFAPSGKEIPYLVSVAAETAAGRDQSKLVAWDVAAETPVAEHVLPWQATGNKLGLRPRLAGWRNSGRSVAALAWGPKVQNDKQVGGGYLAVWPFEQGLAPQEISDRFEASNTIAHYGPTADGDLFVAADDFLKGNQFGWRLNWFEVVAGHPQGDPFEHQFGPTAVPRRPRELATLSAAGGLNLAAVILGKVKQGRFIGHELQLIQLNNQVKVLSTLDLGNPADYRRAPVLATSAEGKHLALGGFGDQSVRVFVVDDLLRGQTQPQLIRSVGSSIAEVGFARHSESNSLGLIFQNSSNRKDAGETQALTTGDLVFDLKQRQFQKRDANSDWKMANSGPGPYSYSVSGDQLLITENGRVVSRIDPPPSDRPIQVGITNQTKPALVALAAHLNGEALIWLYEAGTGQAFRQLNAHTLPVHSLAFSDDGSLLASAGEDQFSCVWDLTNLDEVFGRRGTLDGVTLRDAGDHVIVDRIQASGLDLRDGDRLLGVVEDGEVIQQWQNPLDVYDSFWELSPGEKLAARVSRGARQQDVLLPASQALDEQKPLFSMFLFRDDDQNDAQMLRWIGWSPSGYYDASDQDAEQTLGWHFNRLGKTPPTSFARADRYRKEYHYPGLLPYLIENRQPPLLAFRPALPMPAIDFVFPDDLQLATSEDSLTRVRHRQLRLFVRRYPASEIRSIEFHVNGEKKGNFQMMPDASWLADIDEDAWARGIQEFQAVLYGRDKRYRDSLSVRYVPPAPTIDVADTIKQNTDNEQLSFSATVAPGVDGEPTSYWLVHQHYGGIKEYEPQTVMKTTEFTPDVKLFPGLNQIEIHAANVNAVDGQRSLESAHRSVQTTYMKPTPLSLAVREVVSGSGVPEETSMEFAAGIPIVVEQQRMLITLDFQAGRESKIARRIGGNVKQIPMKGFRPHELFRTTDSIDLHPGIQTVSYEASNGAGEKSQTAVRFDFRPPLPRVARVTQPPPRTSFVAGGNVPVGIQSIPIGVQLEGYDPENAPDIEAIRNGSVVKATASISDDGLLSVEMPVVTGDNDVRIQLTNEWRPGERVTAPVHYELSRPPIILPIDPPTIEESPFVDMVFDVASYERPNVVTINGNAVPEKDINQVAGTQTWRVTTRSGLEPGKNRFLINAWNVDGESIEPGQLELNFVPPPEPEPVALISLIPQGDVKTPKSELAVRLTVNSHSPLTGVNVFHDQRLVNTFKQEEPTRRESYVVDRTVKFTLTPGPNLITVRAANGGGEAHAALSVSRTEPPVQIVFSKLSTRLPNGQVQEIMPASRDGSSLRFEESAAHWNSVLHGYVKWSIDSPDLKAERCPVQVWVNGFQQFPGLLDPMEGGERIRRFAVPIMLNQSSDNRVEIRLPDLKEADENAVNFVVDCNQPQLNQRLHAVIVGVGVPPKEEASLLDRFARAMEVPLDAWQGRSFETTTGAFRFGRVYNVWTGDDLDDTNVFGSLHRIAESIRQLNVDEPQNDVVMLYYQGGELVEQPEEFFLTMQRVVDEPLTPAALRRRHLSSLDLTRVIKRMQGAQVLLLDVARTPSAAKMPYAKLTGFEQAAVLRYAWLQLPERMKSQLLIAISAANAANIHLGELRDEVQGQAQAVDNQFPHSLRFEHHVPESLRELLVIRTSAP